MLCSCLTVQATTAYDVCLSGVHAAVSSLQGTSRLVVTVCAVCICLISHLSVHPVYAYWATSEAGLQAHGHMPPPTRLHSMLSRRFVEPSLLPIAPRTLQMLHPPTSPGLWSVCLLRNPASVSCWSCAARHCRQVATILLAACLSGQGPMYVGTVFPGCVFTMRHSLDV